MTARELDRTVRSSVSATAAPCDPVGWDESAPCRRFYFIAPATGRLSIDNAWNGVPPLDATIVIPANRYVATSTDNGFNRVSLSASLIAGVRYEVRVNSYYGAQVFDMTATFAR
jgi:hypothetical protein